jgi:DNA replication and repair protein RecF
VFLKRLVLRNFRSYRELNLELRKKINYFIGDNAQGKTNLLEAIYCLCTTKSHRTYSYEEMIRDGQDGFYLKGDYSSDEGGFTLEFINLLDGRKRAKLNGKPIEKLSDIVGIAKAVIFSPESLMVVKGAPSERRRFLDILISQIDRVYLHDLQSYQSVIKQRNELLKHIREGQSEADLLDVWDKQAVQLSSRIVNRRRDTIERILSYASETHTHISGGERLNLAYLVNGNSLPSVDYSAWLSKSLRGMRDKDILRGSTTLGPHRDDIGLYVEGNDARRFCSQGQQRTIALSLKMSELNLISEETGKTPLVLLDDVSSELDSTRGDSLHRLLDRLDAQIFLTATHIEGTDGLPDLDVFTVGGGSVRCMR